MKKVKSRKRVNLSQKKLNRNVKEDVSESLVGMKLKQEKEKVMRPKTSYKQNKLNAGVKLLV